MNMQLLIIFIVCNALNVIIQTIKSLATVKCNKYIASLVNAIAYGFYTYIVILTVCELNTLLKAIIVGSCNLIGVFIVKWAEEMLQKDRLWKIELTIGKERYTDFALMLESAEISYNFTITNDKWACFNCYCANQKESAAVREIAKKFNAKYFVAESKNL